MVQIDPHEMWWDVVNWILFTQDRNKWYALANTILKFQVLQNKWNSLGSRIINFSRRNPRPGDVKSRKARSCTSTASNKRQQKENTQQRLEWTWKGSVR